MISQFYRADDDLIAVMRVRTTGTRIALGGLAAVTAWLLHHSAWPAAWYGLYCLTQGADYIFFRTAHAAWLRLTSLALSVVVFTSLSVYNWFLGGNEGRIFAAISICCSLISVAVTLYPSRRYLFAALVPHAACLLGLPLATLVLEPQTDRSALGVILISIVTFLVYLTTATRKLAAAMNALRASGAEAERLRRAAEAANTAKTNFLAVITHEIRTPMNAVVSAVNLLRRTRLDEEQKSHLQMLNEASNVLLSLLNDVLDLSKIEAGKMTFETAPVELAGMMTHLQTLFWPQAQQKTLTLRTQVDTNVAPEVLSDPLRLRQILFNLVSNAVKFTDHGTVRIRVRTRMDADDARLIISVEDEGPGIAEEDLERIFLSFEQGEVATTRRYGGSGMGLAISRRLARLMGGDITVRSIEGKGSSFSLNLPYRPARVQPENLTAETAPDAVETDIATDAIKSPPVHVLIVDDHEVNRRIVTMFIEPLGWGWTMAENGAEAVELCQSQTFDVILMDMQMPVMDGLTATRTLRAERGPNQATPIVALSANAMDHHRKAWADIGVEDFLAKPIDPESLITTLAYKAAGQTTSVSEVA